MSNSFHSMRALGKVFPKARVDTGAAIVRRLFAQNLYEKEAGLRVRDLKAVGDPKSQIVPLLKLMVPILESLFSEFSVTNKENALLKTSQVCDNLLFWAMVFLQHEKPSGVGSRSKSNAERHYTGIDISAKFEEAFGALRQIQRVKTQSETSRTWFPMAMDLYLKSAISCIAEAKSSYDFVLGTKRTIMQKRFQSYQILVSCLGASRTNSALRALICDLKDLGFKVKPRAENWYDQIGHQIRKSRTGRENS